MLLTNRNNQVGLVNKTDTLKGFREMTGLTVAAFAGEMGIREDAYERLERDAWRVKFYHLKAALNIVRILELEIKCQN